MHAGLKNALVLEDHAARIFRRGRRLHIPAATPAADFRRHCQIDFGDAGKAGLAREKAQLRVAAIGQRCHVGKRGPSRRDAYIGMPA